jgi:anti-sigma B factor antagonist
LTLRVERGEVEVEVEGAITTCRVSGEIDVATAPRLVVAGREALRAGAARLVIDLTAVRFADSAAVSALLNLQRTAARRRAVVEVVCREGNLLDLFRVTRTESLLNVRVTG